MKYFNTTKAHWAWTIFWSIFVGLCIYLNRAEATELPVLVVRDAPINLITFEEGTQTITVGTIDGEPVSVVSQTISPPDAKVEVKVHSGVVAEEPVKAATASEERR